VCTHTYTDISLVNPLPPPGGDECYMYQDNHQSICTYLCAYIQNIWIYKYGCISMQRYWSSLRHSFLRTLFLLTAEFFAIQQLHAQTLVCLSNREIVDASRWCTFHCKNGEYRFNNRFFSNCFGLIHVAIQSPSIITAFVHHPSASTVSFIFSKTRACSFLGLHRALD